MFRASPFSSVGAAPGVRVDGPCPCDVSGLGDGAEEGARGPRRRAGADARNMAGVVGDDNGAADGPAGQAFAAARANTTDDPMLYDAAAEIRGSRTSPDASDRADSARETSADSSDCSSTVDFEQAKAVAERAAGGGLGPTPAHAPDEEVSAATASYAAIGSLAVGEDAADGERSSQGSDGGWEKASRGDAARSWDGSWIEMTACCTIAAKGGFCVFPVQEVAPWLEPFSDQKFKKGKYFSSCLSFQRANVLNSKCKIVRN